MTENKIALKTIKELLQHSFFIPSYQRGYRWTERQVRDLLNDINEFSPEVIKGSVEKTWYCLQPIVVKAKFKNNETRTSFRDGLIKNSTLENDEIALKETKNLINSIENHKFWEVIDGQQRLTTIFLIFMYLEKNPPFALEYETRNTGNKNSSIFLENIDSKTDEESNKNIDYFHVFQAYQTIKIWFKEKEANPKNYFNSKFNDYTKVIWYETTDEDSIDIFTRINMGKIPLTNAELIKALFLNSSNFKSSDEEKLRLKQIEIATEWDKMEYALQDDDFWYFLNNNENTFATRIEFIFNLMSNKTKKDDEYFTFRYFVDKFNSELEISVNWLEIKQYFQTLEEWFKDRELYHKVGFLIATGTELKEILKEKKEQTKTAFKVFLVQKISEKVKFPFDELAYNNGPVRNILLLHNIKTMLNNKNETSHFPFDRYKNEHWDVEHIHAIATEVRVKKENQWEWLKDNFVKTEKHNDATINIQIEKIKAPQDGIEDNDFSNLIEYVLGEEDNTIRNLCLLDRGTNRSYKNDGFKEKRNKIIENELTGTFIPICTKNVFMKYYSKTFISLDTWNEEDRNKYSHNLYKNTQVALRLEKIISNLCQMKQ